MASLVIGREDRGIAVEPWMAVATALTIVSWTIGLILPPIVGLGRPHPFGAVLYWFIVLFLTMAAISFSTVVVMALRGVASPLQTIRQSLDRRRLFSLLTGVLLVALNLTAFGMIKPLLGYFGFGADSFLANIDRIIFGTDAWQVIEWTRHPLMGEAYHALWLAWISIAVVVLLWRRPSADKSRMLIVYFLLWSAIGPIVHITMPAAGPVLSAALTGHGFEGLQVVPADAQKFNYLIDGYLKGEFNPGGGISAMPSLHVATMAWTVWVWRGWLRWVAIILTGYMWVASVALGWHYAVDGAVGIIVVWVAAFIRLPSVVR